MLNRSSWSRGTIYSCTEQLREHGVVLDSLFFLWKDSAELSAVQEILRVLGKDIEIKGPMEDRSLAVPDTFAVFLLIETRGRRELLS